MFPIKIPNENSEKNLSVMLNFKFLTRYRMDVLHLKADYFKKNQYYLSKYVTLILNSF